MIQVEKLSYGFPEKELYKEVSFTIEPKQHCAFIGSNGTGKTTLVDMIIDPERYLFDGKIIRSDEARIGYVTQFYRRDEAEQNMTVFEYLSRGFVENQAETAAVCEEMGMVEDLEPLMERYQELLDLFQAMDGDHYESNIKKQLYLANMTEKEQNLVSSLSGGEYKLLQVMKEMLFQPNLLIMDEPDIFLDFENINGLRELINAYEGTLLVITHSRYLLNHCFNKILHLENMDIQEFEGTYADYNVALTKRKIQLQEQVAEEQEEIERTAAVVDRMRVIATNSDIATLGRALHAKDSYLGRLRARAIKDPFVFLRSPGITLPKVSVDPETVALKVENYNVAFDDTLLENVSFEIKAGQKVAIVGPNGTGKTTLLREIWKNQNPAIQLGEDVKVGFLSQLHGEMLDGEHTIFDEFMNPGFEKRSQVREFMKDYYFEGDVLKQKIKEFSGGEQNLLQLAKIAVSDANFLILDEPTSHLDTYSQIALEKAIEKYQGTVIMVSHDFYNIVNCCDYVLFVDNKTIRSMRMRNFRKMVYDKHFKVEYLELEQKKKDLETRTAQALEKKDFQLARELCDKLEVIVNQM